MRKLIRSSLLTALVSFVCVSGAAIATWIRGDHGKAVQILGLAAVIALLLLAVARSKNMRRWFYDVDERGEAIGMFAAALAGFATFAVLYLSFLIEHARGHSGQPYFWLSGLYVGLFVALAILQGFRR